jgi:hypothetical protein
MSNTIPYIFCRYQMTVGEDVLHASGQSVFLADNQGHRVPQKQRGDSTPDASVLFCEVTQSQEDGLAVISFMIGLQPGVRTIVGYDAETQRRTRGQQSDTHIKFAHVVVLPEHGLMAMQDRTSDLCIPARSAQRALRSVLRALDGDLAIIHLTDADVRRAVNTWELLSYQYSVRPLNPVSLSDLTNERSDRMKAENVGREVGTLTAMEGTTMHAADGTIAQTQEMVNVGYGQNGFKGITPDGHIAHVPKPTFHMEKAKNLAERDKPRFMRVMFDVEEDDEAPLSPIIAAALMRFYAPNETPETL